MRCTVGGSQGLQQQKKGAVQLQTVTKVQDSVLYVTHQEENSYWINVLFIGTHVAPNKASCSQERRKKPGTHLKLSRRTRERRMEEGFESCAQLEQNPYQIPGEGKKSCSFLPLNMLAKGLAAQLASHKQQWHNNDRNNNSNDNNDRNYVKDHNSAAATDAVAKLFLNGRALVAQQNCNHAITDVANMKPLWGIFTTVGLVGNAIVVTIR